MELQISIAIVVIVNWWNIPVLVVSVKIIIFTVWWLFSHLLFEQPVCKRFLNDLYKTGNLNQLKQQRKKIQDVFKLLKKQH